MWVLLSDDRWLNQGSLKKKSDLKSSKAQFKTRSASDVPLYLYRSTRTFFFFFSRPYFSLSEPQHLRKTHHRPRHDDVIRQVPTAFEPDYRWQCGTLKTPHEPCQPSSPQTVAHSHRVHEVTGSLLLLIHVCFSCCCFFFFFFALLCVA